MGLFGKLRQIRIINPVSGSLKVVACSPSPDIAGEVTLLPRCDIDGVIIAERVAPTAVHFRSRNVPKPKWPQPGMMLPVTVDLADPSRFSPPGKRDSRLPAAARRSG